MVYKNNVLVTRTTTFVKGIIKMKTPFNHRLRSLSIIAAACVVAVLAAVPAAAQTGAECPKWTVPLSYNETATGTISNDAFAEVYCFAGQAGDEVTISLSATSGNLDTLLMLSNIDASEVYADNDDIDSSTRDSQITVTLPQTQNYLITATRYEMDAGTSTGGFEVSLDMASSTDVTGGTNPFTLADCPSDTIPLSYGDTLSGVIDKDVYLYGYCFVGSAGDEVTIDVAATSGNLDTYLLLTDADFSEEYGRNDDITSGVTDSQIIATLPANNVYVIGVSRYELEEGTTTGGFALTVEADVAQTVTGVKPGLASTPTVTDDCSVPPLSDLVRGAWYVEDETERIEFDFSCDGSLGVTFGKDAFTTTYTFVNSTITIDLDGEPLILTDVIVAADILMAINSGNDNLILFLNTEAELED